MKFKKNALLMRSLMTVAMGAMFVVNVEGGPSAAPAPAAPKQTLGARISGAFSSAKQTVTSMLPGGSSRTTAVRDEGHSSRQATPSLRDRASGAVAGIGAGAAVVRADVKKGLENARVKVGEKVEKAKSFADKKVDSALGHVSEAAASASSKIGEMAAKRKDGMAKTALGKVKEGLDAVGKKAQEKKDALEKKRAFKELAGSDVSSDPKKSKPSFGDKVKKLKEAVKLKVMGGEKKLGDDVTVYKKGIKGTVEEKARQLKEYAKKKGKEVRRDVGQKVQDASDKIGKYLEKKDVNPHVRKFLEKTQKGLGTVSFNAQLKMETLKMDRAKRSRERYDTKIAKLDVRIEKAQESGDAAKLEKLNASKAGLEEKRKSVVKREAKARAIVTQMNEIKAELKAEKQAKKEEKAAAKASEGVTSGGEHTTDALTKESKKGMSTKKKVAIGAGVAAAVGAAALIAGSKNSEEASEGSSTGDGSVEAPQ